MRLQTFSKEEVAMMPIAVGVLDTDVMVIASDTGKGAGEAFTPLRSAARVVEVEA